METFTKRLERLLCTRPLGCGCALFLLLSGILLFAPTLTKLILAPLTLGAFALFLWFSRRRPEKKKRFSVLSVSAILLFLSCFSTFFAYNYSNAAIKEKAENGEQGNIACYITETVYSKEHGSLCIARVQGLDGDLAIHCEILLSFEGEAPESYKILQGDCSFFVPSSELPDFDSAAYYRSKGIFACAKADQLFVSEKRPFTLSLPIGSLREGLQKQISSFTEGETEGLCSALLLGNKSLLSDSLKRDFRVLGVSHILAVSGLHLSILFIFADFLLRKFRLPLKARCILLLLSILFYMTLCGFAPSIVRAGIMLSLLTVSKILDEEADSFTSLLVAGGIIVFFSPFSITDVSFLLSFSATFGILYVSEHFRRPRQGKEGAGKRLWSSLRNSLLVSYGAQLAVLPLIVWQFGYLSCFAPVSTLLFSALLTLILYLLPFSLLLSFIPFLENFAGTLLSPLCQATARLASFAEYVKNFYVALDWKRLLPILLLLGLSVLLLFLSRRKKLFLHCTLSLYLLLCILSFLLPHFAEPQMIASVRKNNDVLIFFDCGESALVDLSDGSGIHLRYAQSVLKTTCPEYCFDKLVLTHFHVRHLSALRSLLESSYLETLYMPLPETEKEAEIFEGLRSIALNSDVEVVVYTDDQKIRVGRELTLYDFEKSVLDRSTHPVLSFEISAYQRKISYLSSSVWETKDHFVGDLLYIGEHGPVNKSLPPPELTEGKRVLLPTESLKQEISFGEVVSLPFVYRFEE